MEYKNYYTILGVDKSATEKDIKRAYRQLARKFHPDKNPDDKAAEEKFKEINEAYEVLGDPGNRAKYDQLGRSYHRYQQMGGSPGGFDYSQWSRPGGAGAQYQQVNIDFDDLFGGSSGFSDFFQSIFGGGRRTRSSNYESLYGQQVPQKGQDIEYKVDITLEEAFQGTTRTLSREGSDQITARIPRGAKSGTKVRLSGKGDTGPAGPGNLYLVIRVVPHQSYKRDGNNLAVDVPVDVVDAVLGSKVTVPTLSGPVKLSIPPATQGGQIFRLKGKGMPDLRSPDEFGDLLVKVRIRVPEKLNDDEQALYKQLADLRKNDTSR